MVPNDNNNPTSSGPERRGGATVAAVSLSWIQEAVIDESRPAESAFALWWNTSVQFIMNPTIGTLRVLNQESQDSVTVSSAGSGLVRWFLPWCNTYDEVTNKALVFRILRPGESGRGTRIFSIFQDYRSDTAMWLPAGVADFGMREPIELVPGSGNFLPPASVINLRITVVQPNNRLVPAADVVVP
jgi:hypothetical protein